MTMKADYHQLWAKATRPGLCLFTNSPGRPSKSTCKESLTSRNKSTVSNKRLPTMLGALALLWLLAHAHFADTHKLDGCTFPSKWAGRWFQSGVIQQIVIEGDRLSSKGKCLSSEGDKFLLVDEKGCYRCVVIHEKHINVLQYKETYCLTREALPNACSLITGDALLYSMFRENATPERCPLIGPFSFTYNRGHGDCKSPVSSIESCTEESRLLLNYQACPDVHGSESAVEELECLATWKEGSLRYLVGKVHHNHATSNEDRYRCFVYEKTNGIGSHSLAKEGDGVEYRVAQSGDATCNGLFSATEGSRTMALKRVPLTWKCKFPSWMTFPGHWHTLDYSSTYSFHQKNEILRITNQTGADIKVHCAHVKATSPTGNSVALVAHWQHHCVGRYVCLAFHRRGAHAAELQAGRFASRPEDACSPLYFQPMATPFLTLVTTNPEARDCPYFGKFSIAGLKILQRNTRSLLTLSESTKHKEQNETSTEPNEGIHHKKIRKHNHRKHKHSGNQEDFDDPKMVTERKRKKYEKFLEKVFSKEKAREEKRHKKLMEAEENNRAMFTSTMSTLSNTTEHWSGSHSLNMSSQHLLRSRRSSSNTDRVPCVSNDYTMLDIGCNSQQSMEFHSSCDNKDFITAYSCHGGWSENGTSFLITTPLTRDSIGAKRYCFIYKESPDRMIHFTRSSVSCDRNIRPGIDGALVFNASTLGECMETSKATTMHIFRWMELLDCLILHCIIFVLHIIISR